MGYLNNFLRLFLCACWVKMQYWSSVHLSCSMAVKITDWLRARLAPVHELTSSPLPSLHHLLGGCCVVFSQIRSMAENYEVTQVCRSFIFVERFFFFFTTVRFNATLNPTVLEAAFNSFFLYWCPEKGHSGTFIAYNLHLLHENLSFFRII